MRYRMGDLVELVTETNSDLKYGLDDIVGVTLEKQMIPTIANLTQTNLDDFIIVHPKDFVYNPRTHGKKIGLGFNTTDRCFISTWNNNTFRVKPEMSDAIIPEFLYMHFLRERWDKEACFNAWGSSTVVLLWSSFCDMKINVPPISEQRKIVHDYKVITDRIELLRRMNEKLEEQALALFKGWFVSYQPFGEAMPDDWKTVTLGDVANMGAGGDRPDVCFDNKTEECKVPIYSNGIEKDGLYGFTDVPRISEESVTVSARGTIGFVCLRTVPYVPIVRLVTLVPKENIVTAKFLYLYLRNLNIQGTGSTQQQLTVPDFAKTELILPPYSVISQFTDLVAPFYQTKIQNEYEIDCLSRLAETVLSGVSA